MTENKIDDGSVLYGTQHLETDTLDQEQCLAWPFIDTLVVVEQKYD